MANFRLLHISDLHLTGTLEALTPKGFLEMYRHKAMGAGDEDLAEAVAREAFGGSETLDAILISGDLATCGVGADIRRAAEFVDSVPEQYWLNSRNLPTLKASKLPIILLPGNHDRFRDRLGRAGGCLFDEAFSSHWSAGQGAQARVLFKADDVGLGFVSADFTLRSSRDCKGIGGFWGQGKAYKAAIDDLVTETNRLRSAHGDLPILWLVHFPPDLPDLQDALKLLEGRRLVEAAKKLGVQYIFCGHIHECRRYEPEEGVCVFCAGSATLQERNRRNSIHLVDVSVAEGRIQGLEYQDYIWSDERGKFL